MVADRLGDPAQLGGHLQPLLHGLGPPQRVVAGVQAGGERERVAEPPRERDRLLGEREPPPRIARVVQLQREPGEQPRAQRRVLRPERAERLLQPRRRRPPRRARAATSGPRTRAPRGRAARGRRAVRAAAAAGANVARASGAPARSCDAPSASSSSPRSRSSGAPGELARAQRRRVVAGRLLPREQPVRAPARRRGRSRRRARAGRPAAASAKWWASWPRCGFEPVPAAGDQRLARRGCAGARGAAPRARRRASRAPARG